MLQALIMKYVLQCTGAERQFLDHCRREMWVHAMTMIGRMFSYVQFFAEAA